MGRPRVIPSADPTFDICASTGKRRYSTRAGARLALNQVQQFGRRAELPCRTYECEFCGGWHLTSMRYVARSK
jgi:hypothetical protein